MYPQVERSLAGLRSSTAALPGCVAGPRPHGVAIMNWKDFLRRIFLLDLIKGLRLMFSYQRPGAAYTEQYPLEQACRCQSVIAGRRA